MVGKIIPRAGNAGPSVSAERSLAPRVLDRHFAGAPLHRVAGVTFGAGRRMRDDVRRQAPIGGDSLPLLHHASGVTRLDGDVVAGSEAGAGGEKAVTAARNELQRDCARSVPRRDGTGD